MRMPATMNKRNQLIARRAQRGAYLLEALVGILIFSFGILGIVGLQAQSIRMTNDSEYRAEAVYMANALISQMWTDDPDQLQTKYRSPGGAEYLNFKTNRVQFSFQGAMTTDPVVLVDHVSLQPAPTKKGHVVQVQVFWQLPGDPVVHNYTTTGVVGSDQVGP
jgi:type IV pilus assembly protein PilV